MWSKKHYEWYQDACGCDDLYQVCDPKGNVIKSIVLWDCEPEWQARARAKAERICRWLNRRPSLRSILGRLRRAFCPTANHPRPDIHQLLPNSRQIAPIWGIEDVQQFRPNLSDDQAWEVLQHVDHYYD